MSARHTEPDDQLDAWISGELEVTDDQIERVAVTIREYARSSTIQTLRTIGRIAVEGVFGGDIEQVSARGRKSLSLRRLAAHPALGISAAHLHQAIRIYVFLEHHPEFLTTTQLSATHFRAVLPLPEPIGVELLRRADAEGWSTHRLEQIARGQKKLHGRGRGGRPRLPLFEKTINAMSRYVEEPEHYFDGIDAVNQIDPYKAQALYARTTQLMAQLDRARRALRDHLDELGQPQGPDDGFERPSALDAAS